jgi:hypothetical protein
LAEWFRVHFDSGGTMIQTLEKQRAVPIAVDTTQIRESQSYQNPAANVSILSLYRHLEMTPRMSAARILNTTIPADFEHVEAEETRRQRMLAELRAWSVSVLHRRVHTQAEAIRFRDSYALVCGEVA